MTAVPDHPVGVNHGIRVGDGPSLSGHEPIDSHLSHVREICQPAASTRLPESTSAARRLADHLIALHADMLDDIERTRIAHENRLRTLLDQSDHGKGVNPVLPEVTILQGHLDQLRALEHGAELALRRAVRAHYLAGWIKDTVGVGEKQAARLLAAIGDPTWNAKEDRPRRDVAELRAYCGLHVLHSDQHPIDTQLATVGVDGSDPDDQGQGDTQPSPVGGVAPKHQRGRQSNWNSAARMRLWLIATSCIKQSMSPYRAVYDAGRAKYREAVHTRQCTNTIYSPPGHVGPRPVNGCGTRANPELGAPGSPLRPGHIHARAVRLVMRAVLSDLYDAAKERS